jgi:hypothetical protein
MNNSAKICSKCGLEKDKSCFSKGKRFRDGLQSMCKDCAKDYRETNKSIIANSKKTHYENNKNDILKYQKEYYKTNRDNILLVQKEYRENNKAKIAALNSLYYEENKLDVNLQHKEYYEKNKEKIVVAQKEYYTNNKEKVDSYRREYYKNRVQNDLFFRIRRRVSSQVWHFLFKNGLSKNNKSLCKYIPYTIQELIEHLESLFEPWMTWDNYGSYKIKTWNDNDSSTWTWQIDHIIPHSKFQYSSMEDKSFQECWALSNLRPYSAKQNLLDSNREKSNFVKV